MVANICHFQMICYVSNTYERKFVEFGHGSLVKFINMSCAFNFGCTANLILVQTDICKLNNRVTFLPALSSCSNTCH